LSTLLALLFGTGTLTSVLFAARLTFLGEQAAQLAAAVLAEALGLPFF
jgi:hypothetical protein